MENIPKYLQELCKRDFEGNPFEENKTAQVVFHQKTNAALSHSNIYNKDKGILILELCPPLLLKGERAGVDHWVGHVVLFEYGFAGVFHLNLFACDPQKHNFGTDVRVGQDELLGSYLFERLFLDDETYKEHITNVTVIPELRGYKIIS
jgi:hypothetical protein